MSGTSLDGVDVAAVDFTGSAPQLIAADTIAFPPALRQEIQQLIDQQQTSFVTLGQLDMRLGQLYAESVNQLLDNNGLNRADFSAIGCHGQTICHAPDLSPAFSMQIGNANVIAENTGLTVINDFRQRDIVLHGQGAPLVPAFHQALFHDPGEHRVIVNIGGIANITILPADNESPVMGFDVGPGNTLMDCWVHLQKGCDFDRDGKFASRGMVNEALLSNLLNDPYFQQLPPKSTGREYFHYAWLEQHLKAMPETINAADVQATLSTLTSKLIADAVRQHAPQTQVIYVCGGGAHNPVLMNDIRQQTTHCRVDTTESLGLSPDWVEACAFAWLAQQTLNKKPGNLPSVTGAEKPTILGSVHWSSQAS